MGQNEIDIGWNRTTEPETRDLDFGVITIVSWYDGIMVTTLVGDVACVLNLVWTWNFCCKLEIVCVDGSTFVVTMPWGKIIDGELLIFFLWDLITQRLGTIISATMEQIMKNPTLERKHFYGRH